MTLKTIERVLFMSKVCQKCSTVLNDDARFCIRCGTRVDVQDEVKENVQQVVETAEPEKVAEETVVEAVAAEPVVEEPVAEEPIAEELVAEVPVAEVPVVEEPAVEAPVVEEAIAEAFKRPILTKEQSKDWNPNLEKQVAK